MSPSPAGPAASRNGDIGLGWYFGALVVYVAAGYYFKGFLMNWTFGPLFLLLTVYLIPTGLRKIGKRLRPGRAAREGSRP